MDLQWEVGVSPLQMDVDDPPSGCPPGQGHQSTVQVRAARWRCDRKVTLLVRARHK
jgi:hypothetical protein